MVLRKALRRAECETYCKTFSFLHIFSISAHTIQVKSSVEKKGRK